MKLYLIAFYFEITMIQVKPIVGDDQQIFFRKTRDRQIELTQSGFKNLK